MAGSRKKPGSYPEWLFDPVRMFPGRRMCLWVCSGCGAPYWYPQDGTRHGGTRGRGVDPRFAAPAQGPCWRSQTYGVKCVTPKRTRVLLHEGTPNPAQPEQPDLTNIETIIATRGGRRTDNRVQKGGHQ